MTYSIKPETIKYLETTRGAAFSAQVLRGEKVVGWAQNNGDGGATYLTRLTAHFDREAFKHEFIKNGMTEENYLEHLMNQAEGIF